MEVNVNELLAIIGVKEVALNQANAVIQQQAAKIKELEAAAEKAKKPAKKDDKSLPSA